MKKVLIVNRVQFGEHTDSFKYCQKLKHQFDVSYICFDVGGTKVIEPGVNVVYVKRQGGLFSRFLSYMQAVHRELKKGQYDFCFIVYFPMCSFFSFFKSYNLSKIICDIRTLSVNKISLIRYCYDFLMNFELLTFKNITFVSEGVRDKVWISKFEHKNLNVLPLGADPITFTNSSCSDSINLFYIGTLNGRRISDTILGFKNFLDSVDAQVSERSTYDIVGFGNLDEEKLIISTIANYNLESKVFFHGKLNHHQCARLLSENNVGVCYYPMTSFYDYQPPTKLFEYVLSGVPCISVSTSETKKYINEINGVLISDNSGSFCEGLKIILSRMPYNSREIRLSLSKYTWDNIVNNILVPLLENDH